MYKNLKIPAVECLENGNYYAYTKKFSIKDNISKMGPSARKLQEPRNKLDKIRETRTVKLCAVNYWPADSGSILCQNQNSSKQTFQP